MRPLSWSTSYLLREPLGISTSTSNSSTSSSANVIGPWGRVSVWAPRTGPDQSPAQCAQTRSRKGAGVGRRDARHGVDPWLRWLPVGLVLVLLLAAGASWRFDLGQRWLGLEPPAPTNDPAAVAPPPGLELPAVTTPAPVAGPALTTGTPDPAKVRRALGAALRDRHLGPHVLASVESLDGTPLFARGTGDATP